MKNVNEVPKHIAYDLDDTLINTGNTIIRIIEKMGLPVADYREPYNSLRSLLNEGVISSDDYEFLFNQAADQAQPIEQTVRMLRRTILEDGKAYIVSTRAYTNTTETLNILGRILTPEELFKIQIFWCKAPSVVIQKAVEEQGLGDAKLATFLYLVSSGINHFVDDLMFNVKTILEKVPGLIPIVVRQPWVEDNRYVPELMNDPRIEFLYLED